MDNTTNKHEFACNAGTRTIRFSGQVVIFFLQGSIYANRHSDGFIFFRCYDEFLHNAIPPLLLITL